MSDTFDPPVSVIKEELESEPWGVLQEVDLPPLGDEECDMPQQGAALSPVKHEIDFEEHDPLQHPLVRPLLASEESPTTTQLTPTVEASSVKLEEESISTTRMFSSTVVLRDCAAELQQSGRYCQQCRVLFPSSTTLADHASSAHVQSGAEKGPFMCDLCTKTFLCKNNIALHFMRSHRDSLGMTTEKPHKYDQCEYTCDQKGTSTKLIRTRTEEKTFKCDQCEYRCYRSDNFKVHQITHTRRNPLKCNQCNYRCMRSDNFKVHLRTHTGEKPFNCDRCDYTCAQKSNLVFHLRTHTGEKPFKCDQCEYRCINNGQLKIHLRRKHTGEKPFKCDQCDYRCGVNSDLNRHKRKHTGEKPFMCNQCEFRCSRNNNLKSHIRTHSRRK